MTKRKIDFEEEAQFTGYLYNVSNIKESADCKTKYFTGTFQTGKQDSKRLVSFVPQHHANYVQAATLSSPVKLKHAKMSPNKDGTIGIIVNNKTEMEISSIELPFKKTEQSTPTVTEAVSAIECNVDDITSGSISENQSVSISAKFLGYVDSRKLVDTRYGPRYNQTGLLLDKTANIKITAWENKIPLLIQGKSYKIDNLITKKFDGHLLVNTTSSTKITTIPDIPDLNEEDEPVKKAFNKVTNIISIVHLEVKSLMKCSNKTCNAVVQLQNKTDVTVRCTKCSRKQNVQSLINSVTGHITVTQNPTNDECQYVVYENALASLLEELNKQYLISDADRLEDLLLELKTFKIEHSEDSSIITKITNII